MAQATLDKMKQAVEELEAVRAALLRDPQPEPAPARADRPPPPAARRVPLAPPREWLSTKMADLTMGPSTAAVDPVTAMMQTQMITTAAVQKFAEDISRWTSAEVRHVSKDWPVFDGMVLHYITWKRAWKAHDQENYPDLQGDSLRRVLVERSLRPVDKERVKFKSTIKAVWELLDRIYARTDTFLMDLMAPLKATKPGEGLPGTGGAHGAHHPDL